MVDIGRLGKLDGRHRKARYMVNVKGESKVFKKQYQIIVSFNPKVFLLKWNIKVYYLAMRRRSGAVSTMAL